MSMHRTSRFWARPFGLAQDNLLRPMLIALGFGFIFWGADSLFDSYYFHEPFFTELFSPSHRALVFRVLATGCILVFAFQHWRLKQTRHQLELFRASVENGGDAVLWKDETGNFVYVNDAACGYLGYSRDELLHMSLADIDASVSPGEMARVWETLRLKKQFRSERQHRTKDGHLIPIEHVANYVLLDGREYNCSIVRDMSDLKSAGRELQRSQETLRLAQRIARIGSFDWDVTAGRIEYSAELFRIFGLDPDTTKPDLDIIMDCIHPEDRERVRARLTEDLSLKRIHDSEHRIVQPDGVEKWVHCTGEFTVDGQENVIRMVGTVHDITERKKWEIALEQSEERARLLLDSAGEGILGIDRDGNCTFVNREALKVLGYTEATSVLGKNPHPLMHHSRRDGSPLPIVECRGLLVVGSKQAVLVDDEVFWRADGTSFDVEYRMHPIYRGSEFVGSVSSFVDISKRKQAERDLAEKTERLRAANELKDLFSDILSHDLLNLLTSAHSSCELLLGQEKDARKIALIERSQTSVERMIELCESIATYAKVSSAEHIDFCAHDLNSLLNDTVDGFEQALANGQIQVRFAPVAGPCEAQVSSMMGDVFSNLVSNAIKYGPKGGCIGIEVSGGDLHWVVSVSDQGKGISPENRDRVFTRFERVEKAGVKGTGLGLAIAKRIVELHGGKIWIDDNPGGGSVFRVQIPKHDSRPRIPV